MGGGFLFCFRPPASARCLFHWQHGHGWCIVVLLFAKKDAIAITVIQLWLGI